MMKNILVVVDMQNDFVDGALGTAEAVGILDSVTAGITAFDGDIVVTYDTHGEDYMQTSEGKALPVPHCIKGTDGWQLNSAVEKALEGKKCTRIEKPTFGSVELPGVIADIADGEEFAVEFIGLCTDICVVSNVLLLKAHYPEVPISVDAACCAGVTPEAHRAALATMASCQIQVKNNG